MNSKTYRTDNFNETHRKALVEYCKYKNGYRWAIVNYCLENKSKSTRLKNKVQFYMDQVVFMTKIEDFLKIRGLGLKSIQEDSEFLTGLLEVVKEFHEIK